MVILSNFAVLSAGMALGYPAVTLEQLTDKKNSTYLTVSQASWFGNYFKYNFLKKFYFHFHFILYFSLKYLASINTMTCPLGGLLSGYLLDKIGRKKTIFLINFTAIISWGLMAIKLDLNPNAIFIQIMISRFIIGK